MRRDEASSTGLHLWPRLGGWASAGTARVPGALGLAVLVSGLFAGAGCGSAEDGGNRPPEIVDVVPPLGTVVPEGRAFGIIVEDPNPGDKLYFRWLIDYPPFKPDVSRVRDVAGISSGERVVFEPDCMEHGLSRDSSDHRLTVLISDRPFAKTGEEAAASGEAVEDAGPEAKVLRMSWQFTRSCT